VRVIHLHLAFLAGVALAITAGTMVAYWVTGQLGRAAGPSGQGTVKTVIDWLVVALFLFLMVRTFPRRKDTKRPKWMGRLQHGLSGQLDLAREVGCRNGRAAGEWSGRAEWCVSRDRCIGSVNAAQGVGRRQAAILGLGPTLGRCRQLPSCPTVHGRPGVVMRVRTSALIGRSWACSCPRWACCPRPPPKQPPLPDGKRWRRNLPSAAT
jgi:hypothetical protein